MELTTLKKKIKVLEHAFAASAGTYYSINLTQNLVPGAMYQVIDDKEYSINEEIGMPENASFSDVVAYWGNKLDADQQSAYFEFFDISRLIDCYHQGNSHVFLQYWTKTALFEPMLAEQHIVMYTNEENGDILAITYVLDLTEKYKKAQYTEQLRTSLEAAEKAKEYDRLQVALQAVNEILDNLSYLDSITMDGLDATRAIRASVHPDAKTIPIFAMTANAFPEDIALSKAAGMNEHLSKPLQEGDVLRAIQRYVKKKSN